MYTRIEGPGFKLLHYSGPDSYPDLRDTTGGNTDKADFTDFRGFIITSLRPPRKRRAHCV